LVLVLGVAYLLRTNPATGRWAQGYAPTGHWWLSTIIAALPVLVLLGANGGFASEGARGGDCRPADSAHGGHRRLPYAARAAGYYLGRIRGRLRSLSHLLDHLAGDLSLPVDGENGKV
jgi:hypothetical protein